MFQKLLKKHGLSEEKVSIEDERPGDITQKCIYSTGNIPAWVLHLHYSIAKHFRCVSIRTSSVCYGKRHHTLELIGHESDVETAAVAFDAAYTAAQRMCNEHRDTERYFSEHSPIPPRFKRLDYLNGFAAGVDAAYKKQEAEGSLDIIVTTPMDVLASVNCIPKKRYCLKTDHNAEFESGFIDGNNIGRNNVLSNVE